jgi:hypothetical protein
MNERMQNNHWVDDIDAYKTDLTQALIKYLKSGSPICFSNWFDLSR